jgi:CRISPR-associated protein Cas1
MVFVGEDGVRTYASGSGETRFSANLMHQARKWADTKEHQDVVLRMYRMRFAESLDPTLTIEQIRGKEGVRVREAYANASRESGVAWAGRNYDRGVWAKADPINRALSAANACLYGLCHAAIVATGFSPALGFVHTGKLLSFVYDIGDLYKVDVTVPVAFAVVAEGVDDIERRVRDRTRRAFYQHRLLARIVPDIQIALGMKEESARLWVHGIDEGVGALWDPHGEVEAGKNHGDNSGSDPEGGVQ